MADVHFHAYRLATACESIIPALGRCTSLNIPYHNPHTILSKHGLDHIFPGGEPAFVRLFHGSPRVPSGDPHWITTGSSGRKESRWSTFHKSPRCQHPTSGVLRGDQSINHFCTATNMFFFSKLVDFDSFLTFSKAPKRNLSAVDSPCFILETFQKFVSERSRRGRP